MAGSSEQDMGCGACDDCAGNRPLESDALVNVGRRSFIVQSALLAAAAALAACGVSGDVSAPNLPSTGNTVDVNAHASLSAVGGVALINIGSAPLAIVRTGASSFVALSRICPHQGGTIQQAGGGFQCPVHGATFTQTGQWTGGQRTSSMHAYTTSYDAATGILTIS